MFLYVYICISVLDDSMIQLVEGAHIWRDEPYNMEDANGGNMPAFLEHDILQQALHEVTSCKITSSS